MALTSHVPQLKRCLEKIIFQTKVVLDAHHVGSTFTCGVLKTKNLDGMQSITGHMAAALSPNVICMCILFAGTELTENGGNAGGKVATSVPSRTSSTATRQSHEKAPQVRVD
jgi:hypothetical protein